MLSGAVDLLSSTRLYRRPIESSNLEAVSFTALCTFRNSMFPGSIGNAFRLQQLTVRTFSALRLHILSRRLLNLLPSKSKQTGLAKLLIDMWKLIKQLRFRVSRNGSIVKFGFVVIFREFDMLWVFNFQKPLKPVY